MDAITTAQAIPKLDTQNELQKAVNYLKSETKRMNALTKTEGALIPPVQGAAMLGISPQAVEKRVREGSLRSYLVFGKTYLSGKQVEAMMTDRIKRLLASGASKNKLEKSIFKKWVLNVRQAKKMK